MTHVRESLFIMDGSTTTFGKQTRISISRNLAIFVVLFFIVCLVTTGLLVYRFSSCNHTSSSSSKTKTTEVIVCNQPAHAQPYTPSTTEESSTVSVDYLPETTTEDLLLSGNKTYDVRLPRAIIPHSYQLKFIPFIFEGNFTFHGDVVILVNVTEATNNVTLHADELNVDETSVNITRVDNSRAEGSTRTEDSLKVVDNLDNSSDGSVVVREISKDTKRQFLVIHLEEELQANSQYLIRMSFVGSLNDGLQGFYRSSYKDGTETRWIAATQFQPTDARKAFPCFDEPALKAKFKISLARPSNMSTISNMPKISSSKVEDLDNYVWDHYEESVPMSTYLLAFVVSDFVYIKNGSFSIWSRKSATHQSKYALEIGPTILKHYEDFFQIKFPLPKIDMVALPDFSAGAMENWGLITYRESVLLFEDNVSTKNCLQNIAIVIAHELAHQWFGNLVTPSWWTDLWLNEGFASYLEYIGTDAVRPEWKILDQFVVNDLQQVFALDALKSSHQISIEVNNPDEINNIFDRISYGKGAAIIRMMDNFLTTDVFKKGLTNYLNSRIYGSAEQDDLWEALTQQAHKDQVMDPSMSIKEIMDTWTLQIGFPVVKATRNYETGSATFQQERYLLEKELNQTSPSLWWIPTTYTNKNNLVKSVWMKQEEEVVINNIETGPNDWLLLNVNETGYYRVNYDEQNWEMIILQLNRDHQKFDPKNRAQMIDDSLNLASSGYLSYDIALNLTKYLLKERDYVPWVSAFKELDTLYDMFEKTAHFDKFKKYLLALTKPLYQYLGFKMPEKDPQLKIYTRMELLWRSCRLGNPDCIINSVSQFQNWRASPDPDRHSPISPDIKNVVYCNAIKAGGQEEWDFAWQRYLKTNVGSEKEIIMTALGCSRETWILSRYLEWAVTENSGIRKQDAARVFASVANNVIGQQLTYRFLKNNWTRIKKYLNSSLMSLNGIVRVATSGFNTQLEVDDLKMFAEKKRDELGVASRTMQQSIEQAEANVRWMERNFKKIVGWLSTVDMSR